MRYHFHMFSHPTLAARHRAVVARIRGKIERDFMFRGGFEMEW